LRRDVGRTGIGQYDALVASMLFSKTYERSIHLVLGVSYRAHPS
jgi:hypothetical protein